MSIERVEIARFGTGRYEVTVSRRGKGSITYPRYDYSPPVTEASMRRLTQAIIDGELVLHSLELEEKYLEIQAWRKL